MFTNLTAVQINRLAQRLKPCGICDPCADGLRIDRAGQVIDRVRDPGIGQHPGQGGRMSADGDDPVGTETGGVHLTDAPADVGLFSGGCPDHCDRRIAHCARASSASPVRRRVVQSSIARAPRRS